MISFTAADLEGFLAKVDGEPVVMLNLHRYRPDGGRERYFEYLNAVRHAVNHIRNDLRARYKKIERVRLTRLPVCSLWRP